MEYDGSIRINTKIDTADASSQLLSLANQMQKTADKIASLRSKMDAMKDAKLPTEAYKEITAQIQKAEAELNKLIEKQAQMQREGKTDGTAWDRLTYRMDELRNTIRFARGELQDLVDTGKAFTLGRDSEAFAGLSRQLLYEENNLVRLNRRYEEFRAKQISILAKVRQSAQKALEAIGSIAKKAFSGIASGAKKSSGFFSIFSSRLKGIALSLLIFNWISKGFNAMIAGMKKGFENLAGYSDSYAQSIQTMKNAMSTLGNQFAAAFAPIVQAVIPWLNQLIEALSTAMSYVAQFMAVLTGASTFTKAKAIQDSYNKSLEGTAGAAKKPQELLRSSMIWMFYRRKKRAAQVRARHCQRICLRKCLYRACS